VASSSSLLPSPTFRFVPAGLDAGSTEQLGRWFDELANRPLDDAAALARWLADESELLARIAGEQARRYVRMTCNTADAAAKAAYLAMEQDVMPSVKLRSNELDRKFLATPAVHALPPRDYEVVVRRRRTQVELFREENTELQRQEAELQTQQQQVMGSITVPFDGKVLTLQQLAPWFESQDRAARERAFRAGLAARSSHWPRLERIFEQLVQLRTEMARNAGYATYTPYRFLELGRYDYDQQTCRALHDAIADCVVPAVRDLDRRRARRLGLPRLRPWDLEFDPEGRPPLRPFATQPELVDLARRILGGVDARYAGWIDELARRDLFDLMSRSGKAPGGYQYQLEDERVPFLFLNGVGVHQDVQTMLHECGHAFHSLLCRDHDLLLHRDYPIEIAETASMAMELIGLEHLGGVYSATDTARVQRRHLEGVLRTLTWIASIDAFQHWVYGQPAHTPEQRRVAWLDIRRRFGGDVDWSGCEEAFAMQWIAQSHLFTHPFYYIEYAIAQLAALQVWQRYRRDRTGALAAYQRALALGGSRPLPELFATMQVRFDLGAEALQPLVDDVLAVIAD
jgi:oligoendopeptidase F